MIDFAGSGVIHMTGGCTSIIATYILGPRQGRFFDYDGNPKATPGLTKGHSVALQMLGTMILWFGWYSFNGGSALGLTVADRSTVAATTAVSTTLGGAAGAVSAMFTHAVFMYRTEGEVSFDITMAMNGSLTGLVAVRC
jgi:ammonium transporter, Amt family